MSSGSSCAACRRGTVTTRAARETGKRMGLMRIGRPRGSWFGAKYIPACLRRVAGPWGPEDPPAVRALTLTALACLSAAPLAAQSSQPPLRLTRLTGPIELDGRLNEPAWGAVPPPPLARYT